MGKGGVKRPRKGKQAQPEKKETANQIEDKEIKELDERIVIEAPRSGTVFRSDTTDTNASGPALTTKTFADLPISKKTIKGLNSAQFTKMTLIQRGAIPHALAGRDILGEAKTGSGKTLAFLVPCIEKLYRSKWTAMDSLGILVITPTRELAYQIYEVVKKVGKQHDFSAGCVIGGRSLAEEQQRIGRVNLLVATPGRLQQHMDQSPEWNSDNLLALVIDEADRILDLGFKETMRAVLESLPPPKVRQTLLFSATLKKAVRDLADLSLKNPEIISVHSEAKMATPAKLKQTCMTIELEHKLNVLFSFLRSHSQKKMIVFVAACKEVRFLYESLGRLKPGPAIMELHGRQSLEKRMHIFDNFSKRDKAVCLICTDIAARGVDFPAVDWVIQMDCPDSVDSYIHRVGRTARYDQSGHSLLMLLPSEQKFLAELEQAKISCNSLNMSKDKLVVITNKLQSLLAENNDLKHLAQKAFISYVRSVLLQPNKEVFKVKELNLEGFAESLGLANTPTINLPEDNKSTFEQMTTSKKEKNKSALQRLKEKIRKRKEEKRQAQEQGLPAPKDESEDEIEETKKERLSKRERRKQRLAELAAMHRPDLEDDTLVKVDSKIEEEDEDDLLTMVPKIKKGKLKISKDGAAKVRGVDSSGAQRIVFNDDDKPMTAFEEIAAENQTERQDRSSFLDRMRAKIEGVDAEDLAEHKARREEMKKKSKDKQKAMRQEMMEEEPVAILGGSASNSEASASESEDEDPPAKKMKTEDSLEAMAMKALQGL